MDKRFWGILLIIALVFVGVFVATSNNKAGAPSTKGVLTNHVQGTSPAKVTLTEYGDYQCPACGIYYPAVKQVAEKYADTVIFQFRNFPISSAHPNAIAGARAAEAADMQGKFWQMHDILYEENLKEQNARSQQQAYETWTNAPSPTKYFEQYATQLGLNLTKFKEDFKSTAANDRVQADLQEGTRLGVNSTPTFFLDGKKISNPAQTLEAFSKVLDAELVKKGGTPPAAVPSASPDAEPTPTPAQ